MEQQPTQGRKNEARHRVLKGAQIVFKGHEAVIDCVVRNLSNRGACLKVESPIGIPDTFDLVLDPASVRHCRVTWRRATQISVTHVSGTKRHLCLRSHTQSLVLEWSISSTAR